MEGAAVAHFEQHCKDCEAILGARHEDVNHWLDGMFWRFGTRHRRARHHVTGVRRVAEMYGPEAARAAIVHIVRDIGCVPRERDYDGLLAGDPLIALPPAFIEDPEGRHFDSFRRKAEEEIGRLLGERDSL